MHPCENYNAKSRLIKDNLQPYPALPNNFPHSMVIFALLQHESSSLTASFTVNIKRSLWDIALSGQFADV